MASLDLAIIGSGPAALTAALYAARAGLSVTVYERGALGGALAEISHLANFPGFSGSGPELAQSLVDQAKSAGAKVAYGECTALHLSGGEFELTIDGEPVRSRSVLIATGSEPCQLGFTPKPPVSYCALCDGDLIKGKNIAVVGGGNSALQEAIYLAGLAKQVTIITHSAVKADAAIQSRAKSLKNLRIREHLEATPELLGAFDHIFVFIGKRPTTRFLEPLAHTLLDPCSLLDPSGYIVTATGENDAFAFTHQTLIPGLFAAGDVREGAVRQAITAAGDGAAAAIEISTYLKHQK